jgi:peptide/nickel transport system ATP-binding protein
VGESGSGKSVTSLGILGLYNRQNSRMTGEIWVDGKEIVSAEPEDVRAMRGATMAMIFQDPLSAMHPYYRVGVQIAEAYRVHHDVSKAQAKERAVELLDLVGIPEPKTRVDSYPHQFSGGMRQRAMIAMALSCNPSLLIADEPTTALDVTVQAQILELMNTLQKEFNSAIIIITHDLGVVAEIADDVLVMYAGQCVEYGNVEQLFYRPEHPYTWGLLGSVTRLDRAGVDRLQPIPGNPPSLINVPPGCPFHPRCAYGELNGGKEREVRPALAESDAGHLVACHLPIEKRREIFDAEVATLL